MYRTKPTKAAAPFADLPQRKKAELAASINSLFGDDAKVIVSIQPTWSVPSIWRDEQVAGQGHTWHINIEEIDGLVFEELSVDDRDGDVFTLLVARVRQAARHLAALADGMEARRPKAFQLDTPEDAEPIAVETDTVPPLFGDRRFAVIESGDGGDFTFNPADFMTREEAIAEASSENTKASPGDRQMIPVEFFVQPGCWGSIDAGDEARLKVGCRIVQGGAS